MGMPRETGGIVAGIITSKIVKEQEGVGLVGISEPESSMEVYAGALAGGLSFGMAKNRI
jgi:hypothetical protein